MFYEAHVQCLISYHANVLKEKLDKTDARKMIHAQRGLHARK
jgi:hypothetical protein